VHLRGVSPAGAREPLALWAAEPPGAAAPAHRAAAPAPAGRGRRRGRDAGTPRIVACNRAAFAAGVRLGMTEVQAQAAAAALTVVPYDAAAVAAAVAAVGEALLAVTPTVEPHDGWAFLDVSGDGAPAAEARLAEAALGLALALGYRGRVAVADDRFTAAALSRAARQRLTLAPPGGSAAALAALPITVLPVGEELRATFTLLGVRTLGDLARLPPAQVTRRFGPQGAALLRLARGDDPTPLAPFTPRARLREELTLEEPAVTLAELGFGLARLAAALAARLAGRGLGATRLTLTITLDHAPAVALPLRPAQPATSAALLGELARAALGGGRQDAPVAGLALDVDEAVPVPPASLDLWQRRRARHGDEVEVCLARLKALLGEPAVYGAALADSYRPEAMSRPVPFAPPRAAPGPPDTAVAVAAGRLTPPPGALRLLEPPIAVELSAGPPPRLHAFGGRRAIAHARGPLRVAGEWWRTPFARDYFEVLLEDGEHYWLFRDEDGRFFVQGIVD
jgi:protein ImuB